jgi:hypothetical protein
MKKIIFHCGSSKNGSTAIQSALSDNVSALHSRGVSVFRLNYSRQDKEDLLSLDGCDLLFRTDAAVFDGEACTASFERLYEIYKGFRERRSLVDLQGLERKILDALSEALEEYDSVVISAEAFETSLCLRDRFFKRFLRKASVLGEVLLIYYRPDVVMHAIRSWQQWGWIARYSYSEWIGLYAKKITQEEFFKKRGQAYWGNLVDVDGWRSAWDFCERISLNFFCDIADTREHFFRNILMFDNFEAHGSFSSSPQSVNIGWPKGLLRSLPHFYDSLSGDYQKYEIIRQLLIDKNKECEEGLYDYRKLCALTGYVFSILLRKSDAGSTEVQSDLLESSFKLIDDFFLDLPLSEVTRVYTYLSDSVLFMHSGRVGS